MSRTMLADELFCPSFI